MPSPRGEDRRGKARSKERPRHVGLPDSISRRTAQARKVFVIMPFRQTPTRDAAQLSAFFQDVIRAPIETGDLKNSYEVRRSDDTFNITEQIVKDLYYADLVICDLSGT